MKDNQLQELRRRFLESGSEEDEIAYLRELLRKGIVPLERVETAAIIGHKASVIVLDWDRYGPIPSRQAQMEILEGMAAHARAGIAYLSIALERDRPSIIHLRKLEVFVQWTRSLDTQENSDLAAELQRPIALPATSRIDRSIEALCRLERSREENPFMFERMNAQHHLAECATSYFDKEPEGIVVRVIQHLAPWLLGFSEPLNAVESDLRTSIEAFCTSFEKTVNHHDDMD